MADVFLSYKREDRPTIEPLIPVLERLGLTVWTDQAIELGKNFSDSIVDELRAAKVVVTLWTEASTRSQWVLRENELALRDGKLLPFREESLPASSVPLGFSSLQTPVFTIDAVVDAILSRTAIAEEVASKSSSQLRERREPARLDTDALKRELGVGTQGRQQQGPIPRQTSKLGQADGGIFSKLFRPRRRMLFSYRRLDSTAHTGRMYDRLTKRFGKKSVFMDIDAIPLGEDFRDYLRLQIRKCNLVLVVIGSGWLDEQDATGARKLDIETDPVRLEIEIALQEGIRLIPVLIGNTPMPRSDQLPKPLEPLAFRNAALVDEGKDFHPHMDRLIEGILKVT
ncbi:MAG: TIR domain-containing protein [Hyphomonadaceae bacterium]|jgi:hypothetical protein